MSVELFFLYTRISVVCTAVEVDNLTNEKRLLSLVMYIFTYIYIPSYININIYSKLVQLSELLNMLYAGKSVK